MDGVGLLAIFSVLFPIQKLSALLKLGMGVLTFYIPHFLHEEKKPGRLCVKLTTLLNATRPGFASKAKVLNSRALVYGASDLT